MNVPPPLFTKPSQPSTEHQADAKPPDVLTTIDHVLQVRLQKDENQEKRDDLIDDLSDYFF